jgi:predicted MPP superfamily phosphohydrolase
MIKFSPYLILFFFTISIVTGQDVEPLKSQYVDLFSAVNDGPYVFIENNELIEKRIIKGQIHEKTLAINAYETVFTPDKVIFNNVNEIAALSDIHGQFDLAMEMFQNNKIIDEDLNWSFGEGHLVIVGDIFDRGDKVTELLWFIFELEYQAKIAGGRVHFLLGNHEYMILHGDLRYIHKKYRITSRVFNFGYDKLYSKNTILGRWLRSKSTVIKINNNVFVHGGVSDEFLSQTDFEFEKINTIMRSSIDVSKDEMKSTDFYSIYYGSESLIWYRGYFKDNLLDEDVSNILKQLDSDHIVVGHCSNEEIVQLYDSKVFGVDSSMKRGKYGEILIIKKNKYYRRTLDGKKIRF